MIDMNYIIMGAAILAGIHAYTYAGWVKKRGNQTGAWAIYVLIIITLAVSGYNIVKNF